MEKVQKVKIDQLLENPEQPRVDYGNLDELAKSIKTFGQIHPIKVSKIEGSSKMYVVAGHRRTRASKLAGLDTVDAVVCEPMSMEQLKAVAVAENIHRRQLSPAETAIAVKELVTQNPDYTKIEISDILAISKSAVVNYMKTLEIDDDIFKEVTAVGAGRDIMLLFASVKQKKDQLVMLKLLQQDPKVNISVLKNAISGPKTKKSFSIIVKPTSATVFYGTTLTKPQQAELKKELEIAAKRFAQRILSNTKG